MKQEEKQLLLQDLCARLPYDFYIKEEYGDYVHITLYSTNIEHLIDRVVYGLDKLVLRPMSSMTEEERNEYLSVKMQETERVALAKVYRPEAISEIMDWLNKHHFDYRGLIEKCLAIKVTEENNPYEK